MTKYHPSWHCRETEWAERLSHGHSYWAKDYLGKGHARIHHYGLEEYQTRLYVRRPDGWNDQRPELEALYRSLTEAEDAVDALFNDFDFSYKGAVTGEL